MHLSERKPQRLLSFSRKGHSSGLQLVAQHQRGRMLETQRRNLAFSYQWPCRGPRGSPASLEQASQPEAASDLLQYMSSWTEVVSVAFCDGLVQPPQAEHVQLFAEGSVIFSHCIFLGVYTCFDSLVEYEGKRDSSWLQISSQLQNKPYSW